MLKTVPTPLRLCHVESESKNATFPPGSRRDDDRDYAFHRLNAKVSRMACLRVHEIHGANPCKTKKG